MLGKIIRFDKNKLSFSFKDETDRLQRHKFLSREYMRYKSLSRENKGEERIRAKNNLQDC